MSDTELIPNISVGPIEFGDNINKYLSYEHTYFKKNVDDKYMEDYYEFLKPPLIVFVNSSNEITTINCKEKCFWNGKNLIGLSIGEFVKIAGMEPDSNEKIYVLIDSYKGQKQNVYGFDKLGLQIWTWKNKIVTISCTNYDI